MEEKMTAIKIISEQLVVPEKKIKRDSFISESLHADSLDVIEIIMKLEDGFDITIPDEDAEKVKTIGGLFDLLYQLGVDKKYLKTVED